MQFQKVVFRSEKCQGRRFTTVTSTTMTSTSIATWSFPRNSPSMLHSIGDTFKSRLPSMIPKTHTMTEAEWRGLGVQQSLGWVELISSFQAQDILINVCPGSLHASWPWATHPVVQVKIVAEKVHLHFVAGDLFQRNDGWDERNLLRCLTVLSPWYLYSSNKLVATMLPRLQLSLIPAAEITQFIRHHSQPNCVCCRIFLWTGLVVIFQMFQENEEDSGTLRPCAHRLSYREWHPPANQKHYISHFCLADAQAMVPTCRGLSPPLPYNPSIHQSSAPFLCRSLIAYP